MEMEEQNASRLKAKIFFLLKAYQWNEKHIHGPPKKSRSKRTTKKCVLYSKILSIHTHFIIQYTSYEFVVFVVLLLITKSFYRAYY